MTKHLFISDNLLASKQVLLLTSTRVRAERPAVQNQRMRFCAAGRLAFYPSNRQPTLELPHHSPFFFRAVVEGFGLGGRAFCRVVEGLVIGKQENKEPIIVLTI